MRGVTRSTPAPSARRLSRMMRRVEPDLNSGCWLWSGSLTSGGYGTIMIGGLAYQAHRVFYAAENGEAPATMPDGRPCVIRHRCDTPACVNPTHLVAGAQEHNVADMVERGRARYGARAGDAHPMARLTASTVVDLRERYRAGEAVPALAAEYGVSAKHAEKIIRGKRWSTVCGKGGGEGHNLSADAA